ncbi:MAG TPA: hypothetical protein VGN20_18250 [Mucilaginibacter sp.]|jgi:hypothetical protein
MAKVKADNFSKVVLNENIYIYKKVGGNFYGSKMVEGLFSTIKNEKDDFGCKKLDSVVNKSDTSKNGKSYKFSGLILKYLNKAPFTSEYIKEWDEQKLAYFFLIDFATYIVIAKRNISGINDFIKSLDPLPYEVITTFLYTPQTLLEKFSMDNLEPNSSAMRARSVESDNLLESINYVGMNSYMLNFLRVNNDNERFSISANTSRLARSGEKSTISNFANFCAHIVNLAENFKAKDTPLTMFATPFDYATERDNLTPIALTFLFNRFLDDLDKELITDVMYEYEGCPARKLNLSKKLKGVSQLVSLVRDGHDNYTYIVEHGKQMLSKDIKLRLNEKSIRVSSVRLSKIKIYRADDSALSLVDYINNKACFFVNFNESEFTYSNRKLFKDSRLLGSIDQFLTIFLPDPLISQIKTEKGKVTTKSTTFAKDTSFAYAENKFSDGEFLLLDDLGDEWADHIRIKGTEIAFILSKTDKSKFSATSFTEIIGQAQKNIGNLNAMDSQINLKRKNWKKIYKKDKVVTQINRLRKGTSVDDFAERFIKIKTTPNSKRSVYLNINFISKKLLEQNLNKLKNNVDFPERKQAIQILWQISSLIASGREHAVDVYILCKP